MQETLITSVTTIIVVTIPLLFNQYKIKKDQEQKDNEWQKTIEKEICDINNNYLELKKSTMRNELLSLIHDTPEQVQVIENISKVYFEELKGDWYMHSIYKQWKEIYASSIVKSKIHKSKKGKL